MSKKTVMMLVVVVALLVLGYLMFHKSHETSVHEQTGTEMSQPTEPQNGTTTETPSDDQTGTEGSSSE